MTFFLLVIIEFDTEFVIATVVYVPMKITTCILDTGLVWNYKTWENIRVKVSTYRKTAVRYI